MMDTRDLNQQPGGQTMDATGAKRAHEAAPATDATDGGTKKAPKHEAQRDGDEVFNPKDAIKRVAKGYEAVTLLANTAMKLHAFDVDSSELSSQLIPFTKSCMRIISGEETITQAKSAGLLWHITPILGAIVDMLKQAHDVLKQDFEDINRKIYGHEGLDFLKDVFGSNHALLRYIGADIQNLKHSSLGIHEDSGKIRYLITSLLRCKRLKNNILERIDAEEK